MTKTKDGLFVLKAANNEGKIKSFCVGDTEPVLRRPNQIGSKIPKQVSGVKGDSNVKIVSRTTGESAQATPVEIIAALKFYRNFENKIKQHIAEAPPSKEMKRLIGVWLGTAHVMDLITLDQYFELEKLIKAVV